MTIMLYKHGAYDICMRKRYRWDFLHESMKEPTKIEHEINHKKREMLNELAHGQ